MDARKTSLVEFLNGKKQFLIPIFQRDYAWVDSKDCAQLWSDVLHAATAEADSRHFFGSIVHKSAGDSGPTLPRWLIIDGQQRLTTLTLLLLALRDHITSADAVPAGVPTSEELDDDYLLNRHRSGHDRYRLLLRRRNRDDLCHLIDHDHELAQPGRIKTNYEWFRRRLARTDLQTVWRGVTQLVVVEVTLDPPDDAQAIYESLNSTGLPLRISDLVRNYILIGLPLDIQNRMWERYWREIEDLFPSQSKGQVFDDFVRDYVDLIRRREIRTKAENIYRSFRDLWRDRRRTMSVDALLAEMVRHARWYASVRLGPDEIAAREKRYARIRRLSAAPSIAVMRLLKCREHDELDEKQFLESLDLIESFLFRRAVCDWPTNAYDKAFTSLAAKIRTDEALTDVKTAFKRRLWGYKFPSDADFRRALSERDIYRSSRICRPLLERLESHDHKARHDTGAYTIEHILPQNAELNDEWINALGTEWRDIQNTWVHRLGNLTLTAYNAEYGDRSFQDKKTMKGGFRQSALKLNLFVNEQDEWTAAEIKARTSELADEAVMIWPALRVRDALVEQAKFRDEEGHAGGRTTKDIPMQQPVRSTFEKLLEKVLDLGPDIRVLAHSKSVSLHRAGRYFLEIVPRKYDLSVLIRLDIGEARELVDSKWSWEFTRTQNARYRDQMSTKFWIWSGADEEVVNTAMKLIRSAYAALE